MFDEATESSSPGFLADALEALPDCRRGRCFFQLVFSPSAGPVVHCEGNHRPTIHRCVLWCEKM